LSRKLELLAPAGDRDSLLAALAAGADAIYLGGQQFNARRSAPNFDQKALQDAVELLRLHRKRLYVTVNTLINDTELGPALDYLVTLYNMGVDAVIIQDLGLIRLARRYLPDLPLHASTQMTVHNSDGAQFLKELGLKRVVLARELSREEVGQIAAIAGIEIEVFVHGALCVCYSGQCLFSSMVGGRSGNRGRCAQPCRMEYQWIHNGRPAPTNGSHLLSPKDLALITLIPELDRAGVTALKIEGRMKRPEYVYGVVKAYRRCLDRYAAAPDEYQVTAAELRELEETFNRGFTTGYFDHKRNTALINAKRPNNRGVFLGRVGAVDQVTGRLRLKLEADLAVGDQVEAWVTRGGRQTATIAALTCQGQSTPAAAAGSVVEFTIDSKVYPGDRLFKVFSRRLSDETRQAIAEDNPGLKIACHVTARGRKDQPLQVVYRDQAGREGSAVTQAILAPARNRPLTEAVLREHLGRLGNTPYYLKSLDLDLSPDLMVSFSTLNQARREAVDRLRQAGLAPYRPVVQVSVTPERRPGVTERRSAKQAPVLSVWAGDLESVSAATSGGASLIYVGGEELTGFRWTEDRLIRALELAHENGARLVMALPRLSPESQRDLWRYYLNLLLEVAEDGILLSDLGALHLLRESERPLYLNYFLNFFNSSALRLPDYPALRQIAVSPELTLKQISALERGTAQISLEALAHGPLELMVSAYCPVSTFNISGEPCQRLCKTERFALRDRLNLDFPVYMDQFCRMHLLNSQDHCLYDDLGQLAGSGLDVLRLELKTYPADQVALISQAYQKRLAQLAAGITPEEPQPLFAELKRLSGRGFTKGHYFRGVD
jgi:putative protease